MEDTVIELTAGNGDRADKRKPRDNSTRKEIWRYFKEYCEKSTINGFIYLTEKRSKAERYLFLDLLCTYVCMVV